MSSPPATTSQTDITDGVSASKMEVPAQRPRQSSVVSNRSTASNSQKSDPVSPEHKYDMSYIGAMTLDKRVTKLMLKWILAEIKRQEKLNQTEPTPGVVTITDGNLKMVSKNDSSDVILEHNVHSITSFTRCQHDRRYFFYLQRNSCESPLAMFAFRHEQEDKMVEMFHAIQNSIKHSEKPDSLTTPPTRPYQVKTFEVKYQGKCHIAEKKKSGGFIDSWLLNKRARSYTASASQDSPRHRHASDSSTSSRPVRDRHGSGGCSSISEEEGRPRRVSEGDELDMKTPMSCSLDELDEAKLQPGSQSSLHDDRHRPLTASQSLDIPSSRRQSLINIHDQDRTMLLQIDDEKMAVISLDKKTVILEKTFKEISYCTQGAKLTDHFGFICYDRKAKQEDRREQYVLYIFQCATDTVITEVMDTLKKAFALVLRKNKELHSCEFCPLQQYHKLCEALSVIKDAETTYNCIQNHIQNLPTADFTELMKKVQSEQCECYEEANEVLMTKLRIMCELMQLDHQHGKESEFNVVANRQSKLNVFKNKAKKALAFDIFGKSKSQESLWKPKLVHMGSSESSLTASSSQDLSNTIPPSPTSRITFNLNDSSSGESTSPRPRSRTVDDYAGDTKANTLLQKLSNMSNVRKEKTVTPTKTNLAALRNLSVPYYADRNINGVDNLELNSHLSVRNKHRRVSSWRRGIFESVVTTPNKTHQPRKARFDYKRSLGKEELRGLWRSAIEQTILLNRMNRENRILQDEQDKITRRRVQLEYEDVMTCADVANKKWKLLLRQKSQGEDNSLSHQELEEIVRQGVPRSKRGEIWLLLSDHFKKHMKNSPEEHNFDYKHLLEGLTPHQHSILIDLGRTFPQHPYFRSQLGAGQLSLFNVLKAYSLRDEKVGYCQGLGFVAGILLMHLEEESCFSLLTHLMYNMDLRRLYQPDMYGLQISMYQLARLLRDNTPELHKHLELLEITPTLYAAPWFITLFSSTFSIGFVSRVFDFLLLDGLVAIFKVALALLSAHESDILSCDSFETVTHYIKEKIPRLDEDAAKNIFTLVGEMDIADSLHTYEVEYQVFQDDLQTSKTDSVDGAELEEEETLETLCTLVANLRQQNCKLNEKFQSANSKLLSQMQVVESLQESQSNLTERVRDLEIKVHTQAELINRLREFAPHHILEKLSVDYPDISSHSSPR